MEQELEEINYLIRITDEELQSGIKKDENFQDSVKGKSLLIDMRRYMSIKEQIVEEIATANDTDAQLRHRPTPNTFSPCELGECDCPHC